MAKMARCKKFEEKWDRYCEKEQGILRQDVLGHSLTLQEQNW